VWLERGELDKLLDAVPEFDDASAARPASAAREARPAYEDRPMPPSQRGYQRDDSPDSPDRYDDYRRGSAPESGSYGQPRRRRSWLSEMFEFGD
jgi:Zn-finger nucleic acid-binding protein